MHLNAKTFCMIMGLLCVAVTLYCGFNISTPPEPIQTESDKVPELSPGSEITLLDFVSNQLAASSLIIPVDPFRPTMEAIFTNAAARAAFIAALKKAQDDKMGGNAFSREKKKDPFAHLRDKEHIPGQNSGAKNKLMITPVLTYMGFIKRPDGTAAAMFSDSVAKTTIFYDEGNKVHGVDIVNADLKSTTLRLDDGSIRTLKFGEEVSLTPEERKAPPGTAKPKPKLAKPDKGKRPPDQKEALRRKAEARRKVRQNKKLNKKQDQPHPLN